MPSTTPAFHTAERWGPLWGARAHDWAESEERQVPTYEAVLERVGVRAGDRVLDIGCGTGVFLRLVAERGARPAGLDAAQALLDLAGRRVPGADLRRGEMEDLPYDDASFDLVTGFNSFFFAGDITRALREAARVARPGAPVVAQVWAAPERNDLEAMKAVARRYAPAPPPDAPPPPRLWEPGVLEQIAGAAGLTPQETFDVAYAFDYPDAATLGRLMMAPMGLAALVGPEREAAVREEIVAALAPFRTPDGGYRLHNAFHVLVARA